MKKVVPLFYLILGSMGGGGGVDAKAPGLRGKPSGLGQGHMRGFESVVTIPQ